MLRVLQFSDFVNRYDFIDTIVRHADPRRFRVGLCTRTASSNIAEPVYDEGTPRWVLGNGTTRGAVPGAAWRLARILREWRADILHTHHYDQAFIGWAATRLYPRARLVVGRHYSDSIYRLPPGLKRRALLGIEHLVNSSAARIVVPSTSIFEILTGRQGVSADKVDLIPYGFEPEKYVTPTLAEVRRVREEFGMDGRFVLGNFGRLHEEKGHRFLLEAVAALGEKIPKLLLLIVGEGAERAAIERQLDAAGLRDMVRLVGWRRDAMTLMAAVDAVAQSSLQEAFSQVMIEALWMGKPLVITDVSGATDVIRDGETGLLVPRGAAGALARAIERLAADSNLRARLGVAGRHYVNETLNIRKVIGRYEQSYLRAVGG